MAVRSSLVRALASPRFFNHCSEVSPFKTTVLLPERVLHFFDVGGRSREERTSIAAVARWASRAQTVAHAKRRKSRVRGGT
jgi:hypothetical protein